MSHEATPRQHREVELLAELVGTINASLDLDRILQRVAEGARELCRSDRASILLRDPGSGAMVFRHWAGEHAPGYDVLRIEPGKGVGGQVLMTGCPFRTDHYADDPRFSKDYLEIAQASGIVALMVVPIRIEGSVEGLLSVENFSPRPFTDGDEAILLRLAAHAAIAIKNARLYDQAERHRAQLSALLELNKKIGCTGQSADLLTSISEESARLLGVPVAGFRLLEGDELVVAGPAGQAVDLNVKPRLKVGESLSGLVAATGQPLISNDVASDGRLIPEHLVAALRHGLSAYMGVPLKVGDRTVGTLNFYARKDPRFGEQDVGLAMAFADQAAIALENARLYREAREVAERLRLLGQAVSDLGEVIVITDLEGRIIFVNEVIKTVFGYKVREAVGQYARLLWAPSTPKGQKKLVMEATAAGGWRGEVRGARADGSEFPVALTTGPVRDESGRPVALVGVVRDLTREKALQAQLLQAEKLAALGGMAEGIAHTFNNLLAVIRGRAQLLLRQTKNTELQDQLHVIEEVALEGAQTVRRVQEFTRMKRAWPFEAVNLNQLVEEVVEATCSRWKDEAQASEVHYDILVQATSLPPVAGDPSELCEALTNLVFNALDAMPKGGQITLKTGVEGGRVYCVVSDTGVGMTDEVRQRVFNPFFTTRPESKSGLGLSMVYGIVARHGGEIEVESQLGQGSTFTIRLPVGREPPQHPAVPRPGETLRV